jgi:hypothetical protein
MDSVHSSWTMQGWPVHGSVVDGIVASGQSLVEARPSGRSGARRLTARRGNGEGDASVSRGCSPELGLRRDRSGASAQNGDGMSATGGRRR